MTVENLTAKQQIALNLILEGKNVFITGPSGTGKSTIVEYLKRHYKYDKKIVITSTTGISASFIGGCTLHSYLGLGLGSASVEHLTKNVLHKSYLKDRWTKTDILVIDEISMLSPHLFDKIEQVARNVRRGRVSRMLAKEIAPELPFGGMQIVCSGDFLQLPVVGEENFCFEAESWNNCIHSTVHLTEIVRQKNTDFQDVLNDLRFGIISKRVKKLLRSREDVDLENDIGIKPTKLYSTNAGVDVINQKELDKIATEHTEFFEYEMEIEPLKRVDMFVIDKYKKNCQAPEVLELCVNCQVMLLHNLDVERGLANGSRGIVVNFFEKRPVVKFLNGQERIIDYHTWEVEDNGKKVLNIKQIPLKLAWAITVHKSQGMTLDYAEVDLGNIFEYGQAYVALSRVKSEKGLRIVNLNFSTIKASPKALNFYNTLEVADPEEGST